MASSSKQLSVVEKIVGDEDNDYDDDEDSEGDELQSSDEVSIASVIESGVISDNNQHGTAGSHGNDELIAPAADSSLNTRSRTLLDCLHRPTASELARKRKVDKNPPKGKKKSRCIYQKLIRVQMLAKSLCGEEIAREIINVLSVEYGVMSQQILAVMHDCASTNTVAMRTLSVLYPMVLVGCHKSNHNNKDLTQPCSAIKYNRQAFPS